MILFINITIRCFIFNSSLAKCLRNFLPHAVPQIFEKISLQKIIILRTFEPKVIKKLRILSLNKNELVLIKREHMKGEIGLVLLHVSSGEETVSRILRKQMRTFHI